MAIPSASAVFSSGADAQHGEGADGTSAAPTLSRELADFLMDLSVAMHKHAIYPPGHPLLDQAVDSVHRAIGRLLLDRPVLSIGVARRQLIIEGVATDSSHPLLAELAGKLHRHHIGAVKFLRQLSRAELSDMLALVGLEVQRDTKPIGLQPELMKSRWSDVKLFPLTYDRLELMDDDEPEPEDASTGVMRSGQASQLWIGLARAAIAADQTAPSERDALEPEAVARAIDMHDREQAYDQVIVGYLVQIAREMNAEGSRQTSGLQRRISKLVGSLQPQTLTRLLEMGGDAAQRHRFVLDISQGMTVDAVVELLQAAAAVEGQTISHSLVRMLTKLASHAAGRQQSARSRAADGAFREHVERLVGSWSLDDPNPATYSAALAQLAQTKATPRGDPAPARFQCEPARIVGVALEIGASGERVRHAIAAMLDAGQIGDLLDQLNAAPDPRGVVAREVWARIADRDPLRALLGASRLDHDVIRRLIARLGAEAAPPILAALESCPEGSRQERLLSYLVQVGPPGASVIAVQLGRSTPGLTRELLACLARIAPPVPPPEVRLCREHPDPTVRREAVKLLLAYDATRESALLASVNDPDDRVAYIGLLAAGQRCSVNAAAVIRQRIDSGELADGTVRAAAVRAVASLRDEETLTWILDRTLATGGLLRRTRLAPVSPELLASLGALASHWPQDPRAAVAIGLARQSTSASLRAAVHAR
ncbi:MAG: hypothetical protein DMD35_03045 [Gemmatimonadetes bacterium]|nr:MAG: hypothetical protein DMD35_03045 [Gemmatimonadota bacterium]